MGCKHESMAGNGALTTATLAKMQVNLKVVPGVDGHPQICQLVAYSFTDIVVKGSWIGPGGSTWFRMQRSRRRFSGAQDSRGAPFSCRSNAAIRLGLGTVRLQQARPGHFKRGLTHCLHPGRCRHPSFILG